MDYSQTQKKKRPTEVKIAVEQVVVEVKSISEKIKSFILVTAPTSVDPALGVLHLCDNDGSLNTALGQVVSDVSKSHQQSRANLSALLTTRTKIIAGWPHPL